MPSRRNVSSSSRYTPMTTRPRRSSRRGAPPSSMDSAPSAAATRHYELVIIQQPSHGAAFSNPSSRQVVSPALVVQLVVRDRFGNELSCDEELPFLITHCSLWNGDGTTPIDMVDHSSDSPPPPPRTLHGTLVSSLINCKISTLKIASSSSFQTCPYGQKGNTKSLSFCSVYQQSGSATTLANALSDTFTIVPEEEQATSQPELTDLTRHLVAQGANLLLNHETVLISDLPASASSGSSSNSSNSILRVGGSRNR